MTHLILFSLVFPLHHVLFNDKPMETGKLSLLCRLPGERRNYLSFERFLIENLSFLVSGQSKW